MNSTMNRVLAALAVLCIPVLASAQFSLSGTMTAEPSSEQPTLGSWKYTLHLTWDTGTPYGLSHVDLIVDDLGLCDCATVADAINWLDPAGTLTGVPGDCPVDVMVELACDGDPSLGIGGLMLKFEPYEVDGCEGGPSGEATLVLYSFYAPVAIDEPNLALVDKHGQLDGWGMISGDFPGIPCDTVETGDGAWGAVKSLYR